MSHDPFPSSDWERCVAFHGHACPGLAIGFRAARAGLAWLRGERAQDEEIVTIVENDACGVDAVQVLTGCTFGKGNLVFRDHGKQVFTFFHRGTGRAARFALRPDPAPRDPRITELMELHRAGRTTAAQQEELAAHRATRMQDLLTRPVADLFVQTAPLVTLPPRARVMTSEPCAACGEPTMPTKLVERAGRRLCRPCAEAQP